MKTSLRILMLLLPLCVGPACDSGLGFLDQFPQDTNNTNENGPSQFARLKFSMSTVDFQSRSLKSINVIAITATNTGMSPASNFSVTGYSGQFGFMDGDTENHNQCANGIPANGGTCVFLVTFNPNTLSESYATYNISYFDSTLTQTTSLGAQGSGSNIVEEQVVDALNDTLTLDDWGSLTQGTKKVNKTFNVKYAGDPTVGAIGVEISTLSSPFNIESNTCTAQEYTDCSVVVSYNPTTVGPPTQATLTVTYNNHAATGSSSIILQGQTVPAPTSSEPSLVFETNVAKPAVVKNVVLGYKLIGHTFTYKYLLANTGSAAAASINASIAINGKTSAGGGTFAFTGQGYPGANGTCGATLQSSATCVLEFQFTAVAAANSTTATYNLNVAYQDSSGIPFTATLPLSGNSGNLPSISILSNTGGTPNTNMGSWWAYWTNPVQFELLNAPLSIPAKISSMSFGTSEYGISPTCSNGVVNGGANCKFTVNFTPDGATTFPDTLTVNYIDNEPLDNSSAFPAVTLGYTGVGIPDAHLVILPYPIGTGDTDSNGNPIINFKSVYSNATAAIPTTIKHYGLNAAGIVSVTSLTAPLSFGGLPAGCQTSITGDCSVSYGFAPTSNASYSQTFNIVYTTGVSGAAPVTATAIVEGTGIPPYATYTPNATSVAFNNIAANTNVSQNLNLTYSGNTPVTGMSVSIPSSSGFSSTNTCVGSSNCAITFIANLSGPGLYNTTATVTYYFNDNNSTPGQQSFTVSLSAQNTASISWGGNMNFGQVLMKTSLQQTITITNNGKAPAYNVALCSSPQAPWSVNSMQPSCSNGTLAVGATCSMMVQFAPTWPGVQNGSVCFNYQDNSGTAAPSTGTVYGTGTTTWMSVKAGGNHTCVLDVTNALYCFGDNANGELGNGTTTNALSNTTAVQVPMGNGVWISELAVGGNHTCVLGSDGSVRCWGANQFGQCGNGNNQGANQYLTTPPAAPVDFGGAIATHIAAGYAHTCAITNGPKGNGVVFCWGEGSYGKLGIGNTNNVGETASSIGTNFVPVALPKAAAALALDTGHSCAQLVDGSMYCWGYNNWGQLGQGNQNTVGDEQGEIASLPAINFGNGDTAQAISVGGGFSAVLDVNGNVKEWGNNANGMLGELWCSGSSGYGYGWCGSTYTVSIDGFGDDPGQMAGALPSVNLGMPATAIAAGDTFMCALTAKGVRCWGYNSSGQLGIGNTNSVGTDPSQMGSALQSVKLPQTATGITAGQSHVCAQTSNNQVFCWGDNSYGQLGIGSTSGIGASANPVFQQAIY